ncbi:hypothetical protein [Micromonospora sp. SL4-19]|uniref:hypothetical protein n=1 Tax=Micromonospora sp. SL4-19 TaxID=3399129 RepID=UPI003A4E16F0
MLLVAFAPSLWAATLRTVRDLTRVAVTALALVVGLNGLAAAPADAGTLGPAAPARPVTGPAAPAPVDGLAITIPSTTSDAGPVAGSASTATTTSPAEVRLTAPDAESTAGQPRPAAMPPALGVSPRHADHDAAPPPAGTAFVVPAGDPGREPIARRGPPRA